MLTCFFAGYKQLKGVKLKYRYNASNPQRFTNLFKACDALTDVGIKVPNVYYAGYTNEATVMAIFGNDCDVEEEKKKFAAY